MMIELIKRYTKKEKIKTVSIHLIWSLIISGVFIAMVTDGYIITA